jgi:hypothetical protein
MKKYFAAFALAIALTPLAAPIALTPMPAHAQEVASTPAPEASASPAPEVVVPPAVDAVAAPSDAELSAFVKALGGVAGMGTLGIVALVVQGLMLLVRTKLGEFAGKYRLLIVLVLTVAGGVVGLMAGGMPFAAALVNAGTLSAVMVLLNQIYRQFFVKTA